MKTIVSFAAGLAVLAVRGAVMAVGVHLGEQAVKALVAKKG